MAQNCLKMSQSVIDRITDSLQYLLPSSNDDGQNRRHQNVMHRITLALALTGALLTAGSARATLVAAFGSDGRGTGLQTKLNPLVTPGSGDTWNPGSPNGNSPADYVNGTVQTGQSLLDVLWNLAGPGASATIVLEIAGYSGQNTFGFYDSTDSSKKAQLFEGSDKAKDKVFVRFLGTQLQSSLSGAAESFVDVSGGNFGSSTFGMYLQGPAGTFYSDPLLNGGNDNMVAYQGFGDTTDGRKIRIGKKDVAWDANSYVIGWEDLVLSNSDKDYQDMVLLVSQITPYSAAPITAVPEASTLIAGALLILPLAASTVRIIRNRRNV